jgi:uncharacterized protein
VNVDLAGRGNGGRILRGARNWWFLGAGGIARLRAEHLTAEGTLRPVAERHLRDSGLLASTPDRSYSLTVLTSTDCNLGCGYCFQNTGQDTAGGDRPPRIAHARLTSPTITSILAFAGRQMAAAGLDRLRILLFGGEPLLNPDGCLELLARAADHGLSGARMTSNVTLLSTPLARQLSNVGLRGVQVTFDGDRADHDQIRVRRSHGGTFDTIVGNVAQASEATAIQWLLRVNVSHRNYLGIDGLLSRLAATLDPSRCTIYFVRVGDVGVGYANGLLHTGELQACFSRWQRRALDLGFSVRKPGPDLPCRICGPGDGRYGAVVSADGTLSSCWETAGKPSWQVGTAADGYLPGSVTRERWISCGDMYQYSEDERARASFRDAVDADLLDYLDETGRLESRQGR